MVVNESTFACAYDFSVLLIPLEYFFSNLDVHSLANACPRTVIQRVTILLSNSSEYFSYFSGMLWAITSHNSSIGFEPSVSDRIFFLDSWYLQAWCAQRSHSDSVGQQFLWPQSSETPE